MQHSDFLVIGSGIAGLTYALKLAGHFPDKKVVILTKSSAYESNSHYAQGGIAAVIDNPQDALVMHFDDTMKAGDRLCDPCIVEMVVSEGPKQVQTLKEWGVVFDENPNHLLDLGLEGGHTANRIVHRKDHTGATIIRTLLNRVKEHRNIRLLSFMFTTDLLMDETGERCIGAEAIDLNNFVKENFYASYTMVATGGAGRVYRNTTNPPVATGDGVAMAFRAGAEIRDMEFVQFHPTAFYAPDEERPFLISEALRGAGAVLRNHKGEAFMKLYDHREELASRDIVSRAINSEMRAEERSHVYLDCRHLDTDQLREDFPRITEYCDLRGIDLASEMIPVAPAAHFINGGIMVNKDGQTSISNLFAGGECSFTGLHGANRLASNSLLEGLVFAHRAYLKTAELASQSVLPKIPERKMDLKNVKRADHALIQNLISDLRVLISENAGIIRSNGEMKETADAIRTLRTFVSRLFDEYEATIPMYELRNLCIIGTLILEHSIQRKENRGVYFNRDLVDEKAMMKELEIDVQLA